jgi:predicted lysophospholipase L1 biosynthesis ABC-type transport system permease subunit
LVVARIRSGLLLVTFGLATTLQASPGSPAAEPASILVSRQLLEKERLSVGNVVWLAGDASGAGAQPFRIVGAYEPTPDPQHLGSPWLEARLHLPDLIRLTNDGSDPASTESVGAVNVRLVDPNDATAFARELAARLPGLIVRPTTPPPVARDPFVVLERFHLAIALVTVAASSIFLLALMVMLVDERREMVAILRLLGLRRRRILTQVFFEGLLISVAGAAFGVLLAVLLQGAFNRFFQWHYDTALVFVRITPQIARRSVMVAVPLGIMTSVVSSWGLLRREVLSLARR